MHRCRYACMVLSPTTPRHVTAAGVAVVHEVALRGSENVPLDGLTATGLFVAQRLLSGAKRIPFPTNVPTVNREGLWRLL